MPGPTNADIKAMPARIRLRRNWLLRCVHRLAPSGCLPLRNTARLAAPAVIRQQPVPVPGDRGLFFPSRCA